MTNMIGRLIPAHIEFECWLDELPTGIGYISTASKRTFDFIGKKFAVTSIETTTASRGGNKGYSIRVKVQAIELAEVKPSIRDNYR